MRKLSKLFISISTTIAIVAMQVICGASNASAVYPISDVQVPLFDVGDEQLTSTYVYNRLMLIKATFPEGMTWTNDQFYAWHGGVHAGGKGCAGFAYALSDNAFGTRQARLLTSVAFNDIRVGDVLRVKNDTHTVIVLENLGGGSMRIAEGNYGKKIHWGRILNLNDPKYDLNYVLTRYPVNYNPTPAPAPAPAPTTPAPAAPENPTPSAPTNSTPAASNNSNSSKKSNNSSSKKSNNSYNSNSSSVYNASANNSAPEISANTEANADENANNAEVEDNQNAADAKEAELKNISEINTKNTPRFTVADTTIDPSETKACAILHFDPKAKAQAALSYSPKATPCASFKPIESGTSPLIAWISEVWD